MAPLNLRGIRKRFGELEILKGISLDVRDGEFVVLVGPSGCGKSTLLRMIAGLDQMDEGEISIAGRVVNRLPPKARDIAMVFQNYALYPHMTVRKNMSFGLRSLKLSKAETDERVMEAARILGLEALLARKPRDLSGGQRQRVAMGRAIVRHPRVFLFDEPLSNLDAQLRVQMRTEIKELQRRLNVTSIYVTHDQVEAMTMADKIVVMNGGVIEQAGAPLDLYDEPQNRFVAGFIGSPSMNFVDGKIAMEGGASVFRTAGGLTFSVAGDGAAGHDGATVTYGIRPEDLELAETGQEATVTLIENTGYETLVHLRAKGAVFTLLLQERPWFAEGDMVRFQPKSGKAHLFDAASGSRLVREEAYA